MNGEDSAIPGEREKKSKTKIPFSLEKMLLGFILPVQRHTSMIISLCF